MNKEEFRQKLTTSEEFQEAVVRHNLQLIGLGGFVTLMLGIVLNSLTGKITSPTVLLLYGLSLASVFGFIYRRKRKKEFIESMIENLSYQDVLEYKYADKKFNVMFWVLGTSVFVLFASLFIAYKILIP